MITITELAAQKIKEVLKAQNKEGSLLRLYLAGVGCGGPNFGIALEESKTDEDILDEEYGISVVIEKKLTDYLEGAVIDFVESSNGSGFEIRAPKATGGSCSDSCCSSCGGGCS